MDTEKESVDTLVDFMMEKSKKYDSFTDRLAFFLEHHCKGHVSDCENCPEHHYQGFSCQHPEHPSVKEPSDESRN